MAGFRGVVGGGEGFEVAVLAGEDGNVEEGAVAVDFDACAVEGRILLVDSTRNLKLESV